MRPEFMTSMSCNSIYCMCDTAWSSRWLMTQMTNGKCAYVLMFVPVVDILNIFCDYQFVFSVQAWWTLCFTPCLMQCVIFKECIIKVWNVMFSLSLGSVSYVAEVDNFCHICKTFLPAYNSAKLIKIDQDFPELWSQMYCHLFMVHSV